MVEIPARALADEAPVYRREASQPPPPAPLDLTSVQEVDVRDSLIQLSSHPSIASKRWVWRQYDHMVRLGCAVRPGSDAAVFIVREADKILAATSDCNALYCRQDPREGAKIAVAEAAQFDLLGCRPACPHRQPQFRKPYKPENFCSCAKLSKAWPMLAESSISL